MIYIQNRKFVFLLNLFFIISIVSCNKNSQINLSEEEKVSQIIDSFEVYNYDDNHSSDHIYDQNKLHRFDIFLSQNNLNEINSNPTAEKYVEGHLVFEGKVIKNVGVRYKGSVGAWVGCLSNQDWSNPSGYKTCPKLSMKIKINWRDDK